MRKSEASIRRPARVWENLSWSRPSRRKPAYEPKVVFIAQRLGGEAKLFVTSESHTITRMTPEWAALSGRLRFRAVLVCKSTFTSPTWERSRSRL